MHPAEAVDDGVTEPASVESGTSASWDRADAEAIGIWLLTRLAVAVIVSTAAWNLSSQPFSPPFPQLGSFVDRFAQWDFVHYQAIAQTWYDGQPTGVPLEAFFPGFPASMWALNIFGIPYVVGGLLVSLVAGGIAMVALRRLGDLEFGPGVGARSVVLITLAPVAIFLAAPYTEALFLGFAVPAWLAARRGRWPLAAVLACGAGTVRVNGIFLALALIVEYVTSKRRDGWREAPWLVVSFAGSATYLLYLWRRTGDPLRWLHAESEGWARGFNTPWVTLEHTWNAAFTRTDFNANYTWMERAELVATLVGALLTIALLVWRRWGEAAWVGLQVAALGTSYWYFSVPRATLLWWPLWIGLAVLTLRYRWLFWLYLAICVPLMVVWVTAFTLGGHWTG